jgi:hypothetical protein
MWLHLRQLPFHQWLLMRMTTMTRARLWGPGFSTCYSCQDNCLYVHIYFCYFDYSNITSFTIGRNVDTSKIAAAVSQPDLIPLIHHFLCDKLYPVSDSSSTATSPLPLPFFNEPISVYTSTVATFYSPSDLCGTQGMHRECIHAVMSIQIQSQKACAAWTLLAFSHFFRLDSMANSICVH